MTVRRSILATFALMLALSAAVLGSVTTAPDHRAPSVVSAVRVDCWQEEQWSYEGSYDEGWERVTVYRVDSRKCWDTGWGGVQCTGWTYDHRDEVRTSIDGGSGGLGD